MTVALAGAAVLAASASAQAVPTTAPRTAGAGFSTVTSPNVANSDYNELDGVAAATPQDAWGVGFARTTGLTFHVLVEHWNGTAWKQVSQPVSGFDSSLNSVSAISGTDIWAVGEQNLSQTVTEHWNGKTWALVSSPSITANNAQDTLTSVRALGTGDVWAVGFGTSSGTPQFTTLVETTTG